MSKIESWLSTVVGQKLDPDGRYGLQCVDAIDHYGEFIFGVSWAQSVGGVRGAKDLLGVMPAKYWERINYFHGFVPRRGDVLVYGGDASNEWGHTAVVESADSIGINVIQQDGFATPHQFVDGNYYSNKPAHRARLAYAGRGYGALTGVLRPRPELVGSDINYQSATPTPLEDELSADDVFNKKLKLKNGAETTFENQILNISQDLSSVLTRQQEDREFSQAVNGKLDGVLQILAALPAEVLSLPIKKADGTETTLATEVKWLPKNFEAVQTNITAAQSNG